MTVFLGASAIAVIEKDVVLQTRPRKPYTTLELVLLHLQMLVKGKSKVCIHSSVQWIRYHDLGYDGKRNIGLSSNHAIDLASIFNENTDINKKKIQITSLFELRKSTDRAYLTKRIELNSFNRNFIFYLQLTLLLMRIKTRLLLPMLSLLGWSVESWLSLLSVSLSSLCCASAAIP